MLALGNSPRAKRIVRAGTEVSFWSDVRPQGLSGVLFLPLFLLVGAGPDDCLFEEIPVESFGCRRHAEAMRTSPPCRARYEIEVTIRGAAACVAGPA